MCLRMNGDRASRALRSFQAKDHVQSRPQEQYSKVVNCKHRVNDMNNDQQVEKAIQSQANTKGQQSQVTTKDHQRSESWDPQIAPTLHRQGSRYLIFAKARNINDTSLAPLSAPALAAILGPTQQELQSVL